MAENRNGLMVDATVLEATGTVEKDATLMITEQIPGQQQVSVDED